MGTVPILFVDHSPVMGGAERSLMLILKNLDKQRWTLHFAGVQGKFMSQVQALDIRTHNLNLPRLHGSKNIANSFVKGTKSIIETTRLSQAKMIYSNTVRSTLYTAWSARTVGVPFIWHMRDFWLSENRPRFSIVDSFLKYFLCTASAVTITNSKSVFNHLPSTFKKKTIYNAIDVKGFDYNSTGTPFREAYSIPLNAPLVGTIGRLRPWKGQDRFLQGMKIVAQDFPEARFLIVGEAIFDVQDDYPEQLVKLAGDLGVADRVIFTGYLDDVRPALAAMDVFVHPGNPEPFGLVNIEAMAMARPIVAFKHGALPEIVEDGTTGILVQPVNIEALADAVQKLLGNPDQAIEMGKAGRKRAETKFDVLRLIREIEEVFTEVLEKNR